MTRIALLAPVIVFLALGQSPSLPDVEAALNKDPGNPQLWVVRGALLKQQGQLKPGLESFVKALQISPKFVPALMGATETAYTLHDTRTKEYVDRLLVLTPDNAVAHAIAGELSFEAHTCTSAVSHFEKANEAIHSNAPALAHYGACLIGQNRIHDAVPVLEKVANLAAGDSSSHYNLALALYLDGQNEAAVKELRTLTKKEKADADTLNLLGVAEEAAHNTKAAVEALRSAIATAPQDERNYLDLALICLDHNSVDLAVEIVTLGLTAIPGSSRLHTMSGSIYAQAGKLDLAQAEFETAARLEPGSLYGSVGMSVLLRQTSDFPKAIRLLETKLRDQPDDPVLNYLLGDALLGSGAEPGSRDFLRAETALQRAIQGKADFAQAYATLGKLYHQAGSNTKAIEALRRAIALNPSDQPALNQLVLVLTQAGHRTEAAEVAERLQDQLERQRHEEVSRNRMRLSKAEPAQP